MGNFEIEMKELLNEVDQRAGEVYALLIDFFTENKISRRELLAVVPPLFLTCLIGLDKKSALNMIEHFHEYFKSSIKDGILSTGCTDGE